VVVSLWRVGEARARYGTHPYGYLVEECDSHTVRYARLTFSWMTQYVRVEPHTAAVVEGGERRDARGCSRGTRGTRRWGGARATPDPDRDAARERFSV